MMMMILYLVLPLVLSHRVLKKVLTRRRRHAIVGHTNVSAKVAQSVEHSTENAGVVGSIPSLGTSLLVG